MISTALALQEATKEAVHDENLMNMAGFIIHNAQHIDQEKLAEMMFHYSAGLAALTTTLVTHALLTESQIDEMIDTIKEMEQMGKDVE